MLDADGWCLMMVLYIVLSDILADTVVWQGDTQVRCKRCFIFAGASLADLWLALQVGLFLWWLCMLSFLSFFVFGKERGNLKREGGEGAEKDSMHTSRHRERMPQKMTATCQHMLARR